MLPLICEAAVFWPDKAESYLKVAELVGDLIWTEGLVLKGNGLCHGIAGNAYMLHCLFRVYNKFQQESKDDEE